VVGAGGRRAGIRLGDFEELYQRYQAADADELPIDPVRGAAGEGGAGDILEIEPRRIELTSRRFKGGSSRLLSKGFFDAEQTQARPIESSRAPGRWHTRAGSRRHSPRS
jgi:hypothetical protein